MTEANKGGVVDFNEMQKQVLEDIKAGKSLVGVDGALTPLIKQIIEAFLEGELDAHLSESDVCENNRRNGKLKKTMKSHLGTFELETPRDREGTFEPQLVKKRQTILNQALDDKILALFCLGIDLPPLKRSAEK